MSGTHRVDWGVLSLSDLRQFRIHVNRQINMTEFYLNEKSQRDKPWDIHRSQAQDVQNLYGFTDFQSYSDRISECSNRLFFDVAALQDGSLRHKLRSTRFCRVRHCPVCQWRRTLAMIARFHDAIPKMLEDHPKLRYLLLTLTVKNCPITELRETIQHMNKSFQRLYERKACPGVGYLKSLEVTRDSDGNAHPHFHTLIAVKPSYFKGDNYLKQSKWQSLWKKSAQLEYDPVVDIRVVRHSRKSSSDQHPLMGALLEVGKYPVKPEDLASSPEWLAVLTTQMHKVTSVSFGGVFREYLSERDVSEKEMIQGDDTESELEQIDRQAIMDWRPDERRYKGHYRDV